MSRSLVRSALLGALFLFVAPLSSRAGSDFSFSTNGPDGKMATASRPADPSLNKFEIETGDDFILPTPTSLINGSFTGLLVGATTSDIKDVIVEIYRVFPTDSDVGRTSGPPTFSTPNVPTRVNSPSDVEFADRSVGDGNLIANVSVVAASFTALNSVKPGGIHPQPGETTGGNGPVSGEEVQFNLTFTSPILLPADHYFFVPQVALDNGGDFYWLSAPRPIVPPGTPFLPDLQSWTRDSGIDPDWLRVGTDIVGGNPAPTFNAVFSLVGVPEPASLSLLGAGMLGLVALRRRRSA